MSLDQFHLDVWAYARQNHRQRIGPALFNKLHEVRPDLSEQMIGTDKDPFEATVHSDPRYEAAIKFIEANWNHK